MNPNHDDWEACLRVLRSVARDTSIANDQQEFKTLVAKINRAARHDIRASARHARANEDRVLERRVIESREARQVPLVLEEQVVPLDVQAVLNSVRGCYCCKRPYRELHGFYHRLCADCAVLNWFKRQQRADLSGRVALVTGGRVKIGLFTALRLLRDGARVLVTTRFPRDAFLRFQNEADFADWCDRLEIHGLDFRNVLALQGFIHRLMESLPALDILINNAAQTVRDAPEALASRQLLEHQPLVGLEERIVKTRTRFVTPAALGLLDRPSSEIQAAVDVSRVNSWTAHLEDVSTQEMLEVQLVNNIAPFMLCSQLKPLMIRSSFPRRFIVNVSAREGVFDDFGKTVRHPHTNMAKAALNMLTRTAAVGYAQDDIFMTSVDPGWVSNENPEIKRQRMHDAGFRPPLDFEDAAARICDPIYSGLEPEVTPMHGVYLKHYVSRPW